MSRFRFRSSWRLAIAFFRFRRLYRAMNSVPGFLKGSVAIGDPVTLFNVSVWLSADEMRNWSGCDEHVNAVRSLYESVDQAWTAISKVSSVSPTAHVWAAR